MTIDDTPMKKLSWLTVEQQIKVLEQSGYLHSPTTTDLEPRVADSPDPRTSCVAPSSPKDLIPATAGMDTGTSMGRGNPPDRSAGTNMPPKTIGLELPTPTQMGGSNTPQSSIKQLPSATLQEQGQVVLVPPVETVFRIVVPQNGDPFLEQTGTTPGRGNPYGPTGRISPRTPAGSDADPLPEEPMPPSTSVIKHKQNPVSEPKE
jgi:hypothetical protein